MSITIDGNSLVFDGTVTITNFTDPTTGVCTLTLTPSGGLGTFPALVNGQPGQPPIIDSVSVTTLAAGASATGSLTQTSAGGPGTSSHYTLSLGIPTGATGAAGTNGTLAGCSDLTGTAAVDDIPVVTGTGPTAFQYKSFPWGFVLNPSSISSLSETGNVSGTLCSVSVPAQTYDYYPIVFAQCTVVGTTNTVVNLTSTVTAGAVDHDVVGKTYGVSGIASQRLTIIPSFGSLLTGSGYAKVLAGDTAVIDLVAQETASTTDAWTVSNSTTSFTIVGIPVSWA